MKKVYATFLTTRYDLLKDHWVKNAVFQKEGVQGTNTPIGRNVDLGGVVATINWDSKEIISTNDTIKSPAGITMFKGCMTIASMRENKIFLLDDNNNIVQTISHPYLNDIHSLSVTSDNTLLVTSTGLDAVLEFDDEGTLIWYWFAHQNGYQTDQFGNKREIDIDGKNHQDLDYPTLYQTTHVNSVIPFPGRKDMVIVTLFHQGQVVSIDKKTGEVEVLLEGFTNPHSVKKISDGYIISDTKKGDVVLADEGFLERKRMHVNSEWLQDVSISPWGTFIVSKGDTGEISEFTQDGIKLGSLKYDDKWRIYQTFCS